MECRRNGSFKYNYLERATDGQVQDVMTMLLPLFIECDEEGTWGKNQKVLSALILVGNRTIQLTELENSMRTDYLILVL